MTAKKVSAARRDRVPLSIPTYSRAFWIILAMAILAAALWVYLTPIPAVIPATKDKVVPDAYHLLAAQELGETVSMFVTWVLGLFAVVAFVTRDKLRTTPLRGTIESLLLVFFILTAAVSLYYAAQARLFIVLQLEAGVFLYDRVETPLFWQAVFMLCSAGVAVGILCARLASNRNVIRNR